jgi:hypothetical protein
MEYEESTRRLMESMERRGLARRVADKDGRPQWRLTAAGVRAVPMLPLGSNSVPSLKEGRSRA